MLGTLGFRRFSLALAFMSGIALAGCNTVGGPEMTFKRASFKQGQGCNGQDCASVIVADGRMTRETPQQFADFVKAQSGQGPTRNVVMLSSPGGHVGGSLTLGLMLRQLGSTVLVAKADTTSEGTISNMSPANCYSACAYTLMGARKRLVPNGSRVGVHRMHSFGPGVDPTRETTGPRYLTAGQREVNLLKKYVSGVGIDAKVVDLAESISPDEIRVLSVDEMRRFRMPVDRPF
jgi:hypothetical protein